MSKFGYENCATCGKVFAKRHPTSRFCHWECQTAKSEKRKQERIEKAKAVSRPLEECEKAYPAAKSKKTTGRYVYAWFAGDELLPFYVGKGVADRAWKRHVNNDDGTASLCQKVRASVSGFRVEIIREGLTEEGARLVEATLIDFVKSLGGCDTNVANPVRRQEIPPLELPENMVAESMEAQEAAR